MGSAPSRLVLFGLIAFVCICLMVVSLTSIFAPVQSAANVPLGIMQQALNGVTRRVTNFFNDLADIGQLRERNAELERALVKFQGELVELREIKAEHERLVGLFNYTSVNKDQTVLAAAVIGHNTTGLLRTITLDRGTRDGLAVGMPVVTELGLVGRIYQVNATTAQVQLIVDFNSFVNARLQTSRALGVVRGTESGGLLLQFVRLDDEIKEGDSLITSGLGGNFPRGILIGQVTNQRISDDRLFREGQIRSLVDFDRLEIVLVITDFVPIDLSAFATPTPIVGTGQ